MSQQRLGKVTIKIRGQKIDSMPGASLSFGGVSRKTVKGSNEILGFSEEPEEATIECTVSLGKGTSVKDLDFDDATATFECDTGQVYSLANAWSADVLKLSSSDGGPISLKVVSKKCEEVGQ
jgi:hypothetical protein